MARVTLQQYCSEARQLIDSGAYDQVLAICRHILKRYPKHIETYRLLGEACLEKGELDEATDVFKRLLSADPENFVAHAGLGVAYEKKGALDEAVWHMERALELAPNSDDTRDALRRLYTKRDGTEPPRIKLNKAALARMYAKGSQHRQAIEEFESLLQSDPNRVDIRVALAETLWHDGRHEEAAATTQEILKTAPECLKAVLLLGMVQMEKGRTKGAQAILARARSLDPENRLARAFFGEQSPLPVQTVKIPRIKEESEAEPVLIETEAPDRTETPPAMEETQPLPIAESEVVPEEEMPVSTETEFTPTAEAEAVFGDAAVPAAYEEATSEEEALVSAEVVSTEVEAPESAPGQPFEGPTELTPTAEAEAVSEEATMLPADEEAIPEEETLVSAEVVVTEATAIESATGEPVERPTELIPTAQAEAVSEEATMPAAYKEATPEEETLVSAEAVPTELEAPESSTGQPVEGPTELTPTGEAEAVFEEVAVSPADEEATPEEETLVSAAVVPTDIEAPESATGEPVDGPTELTSTAEAEAVPEEVAVPAAYEEATPEEETLVSAEVMVTEAKASESATGEPVEGPTELTPTAEAEAVFEEAAVSPADEEATPDEETLVSAEAVPTEVEAPESATGEPVDGLTELTPTAGAEAVSEETTMVPADEEAIPEDETLVSAEVVPTDIEAPESSTGEPVDGLTGLTPTAEAEAVSEEATMVPADEEAIPEDETLVSAEAAPTEVESPESSTGEPVDGPTELTPTAEAEAVSEEAAVPAADEEATPEEETLASAEAIASSALPDIERYQLQLKRSPKDNTIRLALARAYRDQEQMKLALEQYGALVRSKSSLLAEAIGDMEGIVASRPDNLEAHELLADLYAKNGQLPKAVDRLRWIQQRLEQKRP